MHLEMASSLPAAEACDVQVGAESPAKRVIKSILAIFMFPLLSRRNGVADRASLLNRRTGRPP
jgi:hypothetical protein